MKAIKIITITLFLLVTGSLSAQEKQNDATWEETIDFIEENLKFVIPRYEHWETKIQCEIDNRDYLIYEVMEIDSKAGTCNFKFKSSIPLLNLTSAKKKFLSYDMKKIYKQREVVVDYEILLYATSLTYSDCETNTTYTSLPLLIKTNFMADRLFKAFNHLASLATVRNERINLKSKF